MDWHRGIRAAYPNALLIIQGDTLDDLVVTNQETGEPFVFDPALAASAAVIVAKEQAIEQVRRKRAAAYAAESDPIFFKAQRGEATMDDWRTAVASIQLSIPYPDEEVTP